MMLPALPVMIGYMELPEMSSYKLEWLTILISYRMEHQWKIETIICKYYTVYELEIDLKLRDESKKLWVPQYLTSSPMEVDSHSHGHLTMLHGGAAFAGMTTLVVLRNQMELQRSSKKTGKKNVHLTTKMFLDLTHAKAIWIYMGVSIIFHGAREK